MKDLKFYVSIEHKLNNTQRKFTFKTNKKLKG